MKVYFFKKYIFEDIGPFCGSIDAPFGTSGDICPAFQSHGGSLNLHALSPACNGFFRFTSGVTPADLLMASMVVKSFRIHILVHIEALDGLIKARLANSDLVVVGSCFILIDKK